MSTRDPDPDRTRGARSFLWPILIALLVIAFVVLHVTGVLGPGSH